MTPSDSYWLKFWEVFATIGFLLVILGVVLEGAGYFTNWFKDEANRLRIGRFGWFILVGGLSMEFLGEHKAKRIADRENARLTGEAAEANERSKGLESTNLVLQADV